MKMLEALVNNGPFWVSIPLLICLYFVHVAFIAVPVRVAGIVRRKISSRSAWNW